MHKFITYAIWQLDVGIRIGLNMSVTAVDGIVFSLLFCPRPFVITCATASSGAH